MNRKVKTVNWKQIHTILFFYIIFLGTLFLRKLILFFFIFKIRIF